MIGRDLMASAALCQEKNAVSGKKRLTLAVGPAYLEGLCAGNCFGRGAKETLFIDIEDRTVTSPRPFSDGCGPGSDIY